MKKILNFSILFLISIFYLTINIANASFMDYQSLEKTKNAVVTINTRVSVSAYEQVGSSSGTGFVVDKKQGLIVTNAHVVGRGGIGNYLVTFYNGRQTQGKLIYYDTWVDFAFLQINTEDMPKESEEITFSASKPKLNQKVYIVGNNECRDFSFHDGYISSLYDINGEMSQGSYIINLNNVGGSSGSPLINENNEAIGIIYGAGSTFAIALNGGYLQTALKHIQANQIPIRKHIGVLTTLYSLDRAVKHRSFPKELMENYIKKFPDARNKIIAVATTVPGSPASAILNSGDIIWEVNGQQIGPDLFLLDKLMNDNPTDKIKLAIYREGKLIEQEVELYDVNSKQINKIIDFAGASFFEADELFSSKTGIPLKSLAVHNIQTGSPFSVIPVSYNQDNKNIYRLKISGISKYQLENLNDLERTIPDILTLKFLNIKFKNYQPYYPWFSYSDNSFISSQEDLQIDIKLDTIDSKPRILKFDSKAHEWIAENIQ